MQKILKKLPALASEQKTANQKFFKKLKKRTPKDLDIVAQEIHQKVFQKTDCLACGNCCKSIPPIITEKDIKRIAKFLKIKERIFIEKYLIKDGDNFWIFKKTPCTFLDADNYCLIYDVRPKACAEYPHTDRKRFIQISQLTIQNTSVCPAVFEIVENLKLRYSKY